MILKEVEKYINEKYPDITKSTRTAKIKNVVNHIYHYYRGLRHDFVRKNKPVFQRGLNSFASEERFNLGDKKIPLDSRLMKIEFLGPPAKEYLLGQQTNFHFSNKEKYKFDPQASIDAIKSLPDDLVIKNKGYYDNLNFLEKMTKKEEQQKIFGQNKTHSKEWVFNYILFLNFSSPFEEHSHKCLLVQQVQNL